MSPRMQRQQEASRPRVLVVDDEAETCVLLQAYLQEEGITVVGTAPGGAAAVDMAHVFSPDVVLMDVRMPDVDGMEATRLIKERDPGIQVILLTFYDQADEQVDPTRAGAFCFLVKGSPPSQIAACVRRAWEHARERAATGGHLGTG